MRFAHPLTFLLLLLVFSPAGSGMQLPLDNGTHSIGRHAQYLVEGEKPLSLQEASRAFAHGEGRTGTAEVMNFGIATDPRWIRLELDNPSPVSIERVLVVGNPWIDRLDAYLVSQEEILGEWKLGDRLPFSARSKSHRYFVLTLELPAGGSEVLLRVETPDPMILPIFFGTAKAFEQHDRHDSYTYGLVYGLLLGLALYNLVLYLQIRLGRYLAYVGFLSSFLLMNMTYTGHFFWWFWPPELSWWQWGHPLVIGLYATAWAWFAATFLQLRHYLPGLYRGVIWLVGMFWFCQLALFALGEQGWAVTASILFSLLITLLILPVAAMSWRSGMSEAVYLLVASIASALGTGITAATVINWLPFDPIGFRAIEIGLSLDAILLSFGLSQQYRNTQRHLLLAQRVARVDPLTGLYNRRAFEEVVEPLLASAERYRTPVSLILLDLDHFKTINDRFGHHVGDAVLRAVANVMRDTVRKDDILARWGGEEFILLLPETGRDQALNLAERLRQAVASVHPEADVAVINDHVTASLGLFTSEGSHQLLDELVRNADACLYQAKESGRNRVCS